MLNYHAVREMRSAKVELNVTCHPEVASLPLESGMPGNSHVPFGEGPTEKG
ncbi:MAG TPA: hypothetical protein VH593_18220 [Ktedonobacteraceae bacterium]|jgi:hypothetical protein